MLWRGELRLAPAVGLAELRQPVRRAANHSAASRFIYVGRSAYHQRAQRRCPVRVQATVSLPVDDPVEGEPDAPKPPSSDGELSGKLLQKQHAAEAAANEGTEPAALDSIEPTAAEAAADDGAAAAAKQQQQQAEQQRVTADTPASSLVAASRSAPVLPVSEYVAQALEQLSPDIARAREVVRRLDGRLLELQSVVAAALPPSAQATADEVVSKIEDVNAQLLGLSRGSDAVAPLEARAAELEWELFAAVEPHASEDQRLAYRSLLSELCMERQMLAMMEEREAVLAEIKGMRKKKGAGAGAAAAAAAGAATAGVAAGAAAQLEAPGMTMQQGEEEEDQQRQGQQRSGGEEEEQPRAAEPSAAVPVLEAPVVEQQQRQQPQVEAEQQLQPEGKQPEGKQQAQQQQQRKEESDPVAARAALLLEQAAAAVAAKVQAQEAARKAAARAMAAVDEQQQAQQQAQQAAGPSSGPSAGPSAGGGSTGSAQYPAGGGVQYQEQGLGMTVREYPRKRSGGRWGKLMTGEGPQPPQQQPPQQGGSGGGGSARPAAAAVPAVAPAGAAGIAAVAAAGAATAVVEEVATATLVAEEEAAPTAAAAAASSTAQALAAAVAPAAAAAVAVEAAAVVEPPPAPAPAPAASPDLEKPASGKAAGLQQLRLVAAGISTAHPAKAETGGEDAFFVSSERLGVAAVADGVGGWAAEGIDPALYPRELMAQCEDALAHHEDPLAVLAHAHERAHAPGSCTVCLAAMQPGGRLKVVSLGDCGVAVVRPGEGVVFQAEVQEHEFNQPFQMASPQFLPVSDHPLDAQRYDLHAAPGDVLVMGSDGLWDNLWQQDVAAAVEACVEELHGPAPLDAAQQLAVELAARAHHHSQDPTYRSPFAVERHQRAVHPALRNILQPVGGKPDDITVVVGVVVGGEQ